MIKKCIIVTILLLISTIHIKATSYENWEGRFQTILTCNSKSGAAISEVKITDIQNVPNKDVQKIIGHYSQAMPFVATFGKFSTNNFAENTGVFQAFIKDGIILKARYKISFIKGFIKPVCLRSNPNEFDF